MIDELFTMSLHQNKALTLTITTNLNNIQYLYIVHDFHYYIYGCNRISYIMKTIGEVVFLNSHICSMLPITTKNTVFKIEVHRIS